MRLALSPPVAAALTAWAMLGAPAPARADPGYYVVTAYDNDGQRAVDLRYWTVKLDGRPETIWPELGLSIGVNSRWTTELLYSTEGPSNGDLAPDYLAWQNDVLLTQGEWPVDLALHMTLSRELGVGGGHYTLTYGPALQTEIGRTQLNANVFFQRSFEPASPGPIQLQYQWQVRHHWQPLLDVGLQGLGEVGRWDRWPEAGRQSHRAGPAIFGHLELGRSDGRREALLYQAAYLLGTIYAKRGAMFTARVQYTF